MSSITISKPLVSITGTEFDQTYDAVIRARRAMATLYSIGLSEDAAKALVIEVYYRGFVLSAEPGYELTRIDAPCRVSWLGKSGFELDMGGSFGGWAVDVPRRFTDDGVEIAGRALADLAEKAKLIVSVPESASYKLGVATAEFFLFPAFWDKDDIFGSIGHGTIPTTTLWPEWAKEVEAAAGEEREKNAAAEKISGLPEVIAAAALRARIAELGGQIADLMDKFATVQAAGGDISPIIAVLAPITQESKRLREVELPAAQDAELRAIAIANGADPLGFDITGERMGQLRAMTKDELVAYAAEQGLSLGDKPVKAEIITLVYAFESNTFRAERMAKAEAEAEALVNEADEPTVIVVEAPKVKRTRKAEAELVAA